MIEDPRYISSLIYELVKLPKETEWVEFKHNNSKPEEIGEYIFALSNSASLAGKVKAYLLWGVNNTSHQIVGTTFEPSSTKIGGEELESWLLHLLTPNINFHFCRLVIDN